MKFLLFMILGCHLFADDWQRVRLTTFPRSGNHWMRYLIEEATGVATGSVYCDPDFPPHLRDVFPWGGFAPLNGYEGTRRYPEKGEIVVIKTHYPRFKKIYDRLTYLRTVRIVRHPIDSFYSCFVQRFCLNMKEFPDELAVKYIDIWRNFQEHWNVQENVLTVRYEDLLDDPKTNLGAILSFIGYEVTEEDIERAVTRYPPTGHVLKHIQFFSKEAIALIEKELKDLMDLFGYSMGSSSDKN